MSCNSDNWGTPPEVFKKIDSEFNFLIDVCADHRTAKCNKYFTKDDDALSKNWAEETNYNVGSYLWCNPPYSNISRWVEKAIEAQSYGIGTVMLATCNTSAPWFLRALKYANETGYIVNGNLAFLKDGIPQRNNKKGSVIFVFAPWQLAERRTIYIERDFFYEDKAIEKIFQN